MNLFKKRNTLAAALALALTQWQLPAGAAAAPEQSTNLFPDPVVATGKGFEIKRSQVDDAFVTYSAGLAASGNTIRDEDRDTVRSNLLQHLIVINIMTQKATAADKAAVAKLVDDNIEDARKSAPSPQVFDDQIKATGMTLEQVRQRACDEQLCKRILERETTNGIVVSDASAKKFYDDHPDDFDVPEQVRAAHILISTLDPLTQRPLPLEEKKAKEKLARDIRARAVAGEDFGKLVKQYSDDPGSRDKGGEYKFPRNRMVPEFEAAAFALKTNQISELVETRYGFHIIKLLEKFPARHEPFSEVEARIKQYLVEQEAAKALPAYLDKIKAEAHVALLDQKTAGPGAK